MTKAGAPLAVLFLAALLFDHGPAFGQSPDTDSIIRDLRPTAKEVTGPTRGIRPATPVPDQEPAHASPVTAPAQQDPSVKLMVDFRTGSAELTPAAEQTLDKLGRALTDQALMSYRFRIEGHTDTVGTPEANKALSTRRAEAVADYLEKKFGVEPARLQPEGVGSEDLLVPTPDQTPEPRNRVVRVVNIGS